MIPVGPLSIVNGPTLVAPVGGPKNWLRPAFVGHANSCGHAAPALRPRVSPHTFTVEPASGSAVAASGSNWPVRELHPTSASVAICSLVVGTSTILTPHVARDRATFAA